jgi:hypothetical protein
MRDLEPEAGVEYFDCIELEIRVQTALDALDVSGLTKAVLLARK